MQRVPPLTQGLCFIVALSAGDPEEFDRNFRGIQVGLVKSVDHAQRTATVLWHKHQFQPRKMPGMSCDNPACLSNVDHLAQLASLPVALQEQPEEEVVSVYTITVRHLPSTDR